MDYFIQFDQVSVSFGQNKVLNDVCLELKKGESYAIIGKSGTGKSTLLNLIAGFLKPNEGKILIGGEELQKPRKETAFLFQELGLFPWQSVIEAVTMPLKIKGYKNDKKEKAFRILKEMKIEQHWDKYPHNLSGGERQRVALARTLIAEPNLLLMDEPTSALDAMTKEELQDIILREHKKRNATLLFVTHDMEEAVILGQTLLILNGDGTVTKRTNPLYSIENPREQLGFYDECIKLRRLLQMEGQDV